MKAPEEAVVETLRGMQRFLDDNDAALGVINQSNARKRLDEAVTQISSHAVTQVGGHRAAVGETAKQRALRLALRKDQMRPIAVVAADKLREQPEFAKLRLPAWDVRGPSLTAAAYDMANAAEKYTDLFVQEGLPTDFVTSLRTATAQLDQSIDTRGQSQGQRAGATAGLKAATKRARGLIRLLDSLVRPKLGTNDQLLREWEFATHIQRPRTSSTPATPATPATPVATPAPATSVTSATAATPGNTAPPAAA